MPTHPPEYIEAIEHLPTGSALVIPDVSWAAYEALLAALGDGDAVRVSYDGGRLEIVTPSAKHEKVKLGTSLETFGADRRAGTVAVRRPARGDLPPQSSRIRL
jgi:hypothetical protein